MSEETRVSPWKRPSRWVPLVVFLLLLIGTVAYRLVAESGVKREIAAIKARGFPTSPAELDLWYKRVPATSNAALAFLEATSLLVAPGTNDPNEAKVDLQAGAELPPKVIKAVAKHLADNRETIDQLHAAAELTESRYPIDLTKGYTTLLPHLAPLKRLAQLLKWQAIHQSAAGNKTEALRAIQSAFALARSLQNEPILISDLVRIASISIVLPAFERVVSEHELTDAELREFIDLFARTEEESKRALQTAMAGERAFGSAVFDIDFKTFEAFMGAGAGGTGSGGVEDFFKFALFELRRFVGATDRDRAFALQSLTSYERAGQQENFPDVLKAFDETSKTIENEIVAHRVRYMISGMILPALSKAANKEAVLAGQLRCARVALAAERFRLEQNRIPEATELTPKYLAAVLSDPVDGEPLEIEKLSNGLRVEAAGATELKRPGKRSTNITDVAFTILRPAVKAAPVKEPESQ